MSLFTELKHRKVLKVGGGYLMVAWLIAATGCFLPDTASQPPG